MHGKTTIQKKLQMQQSATHKAKYPNSRTYLEIGSWRFEENSDGDLVIINLETEKTVILIRK